jgi:hypothetical protein
MCTTVPSASPDHLQNFMNILKLTMYPSPNHILFPVLLQVQIIEVNYFMPLNLFLHNPNTRQLNTLFDNKTEKETVELHFSC